MSIEDNKIRHLLYALEKSQAAAVFHRDNSTDRGMSKKTAMYQGVLYGFAVGYDFANAEQDEKLKKAEALIGECEKSFDSIEFELADEGYLTANNIAVDMREKLRAYQEGEE